MDIESLKQFFLETSRRLLLTDPDTYQRFEYDRMAEAAIRNVMTRILEESRILYGIEVATRNPYEHMSKGITRKALVDLVLYIGNSTKKDMIYIELKREHPQPSFIAKDFRKIFIDLNEISGACFFHYLGKTNHSSLKSRDSARKSILEKYRETLSSERTDLNLKYQFRRDCWFLLFIFDKTKMEYNCSYIRDMAEEQFITNNNWLPINPETEILR
jgi:hypothetical protein